MDMLNPEFSYGNHWANKYIPFTYEIVSDLKYNIAWHFFISADEVIGWVQWLVC